MTEKKVEIIHSLPEGNMIKYALFDFDGTLSLIREGWQSIMIPMFIRILKGTPKAEEDAVIEQVVKKFVTDLTGKQTIYQMIALTEEIEKRGGMPLDPMLYKEMYNNQLLEYIQFRLANLRNGKVQPMDYLVPGSLEILNLLKSKGIHCYLASGTDEQYVMDEVRLVQLDKYFDGIYGAQNDYKNFSKSMVIQRIIRENQLSGPEFIAFGDGFVEIEDTKTVDGIAVGVATNEAERSGIDEWKRERLIQAGADVIIPDFSATAELSAYLFK